MPTVNVRTVLLAGALLGLAACAGPSAAQRQEQAEVARLMMTASAVHMPPAGVDSCVGITVRLTDPSGRGEAERARSEVWISEAEAEAAFAAAGLERCKEAYLLGLDAGGISPEPLALTVGYGVDPAGKVCAIVERTRPDPIDPAAGPLIDQAAECLKNVLFTAALPAGRVEDKDRVVRFFTLSVQPEVATSSTATTSVGG